MSKIYTQFDVSGPEYRVRPVVRYVITRYCHPYVHKDDGKEIEVAGGSEVIAELANEQRAWEVASTMARGEASSEATVSA